MFSSTETAHTTILTKAAVKEGCITSWRDREREIATRLQVDGQPVAYLLEHLKSVAYTASKRTAVGKSRRSASVKRSPHRNRFLESTSSQCASPSNTSLQACHAFFRKKQDRRKHFQFEQGAYHSSVRLSLTSKLRTGHKNDASKLASNACSGEQALGQNP